MRTALRLAPLWLPLLAAAPAHSQEWELRDVSHPRMGSIVVAVPKAGIATPVGNTRVVSLVFFSCERATRRIAIELANSSEADLRGGLRPREMPRLVCNSVQAGRAQKADLAATWEISDLGDALARGFPPSALRRCASIDVVQNVALPKGLPRDNQRIEIELFPNAKELDAVISACTDAIAAAPSAPVAQPVAPVARSSAPSPPPPIATSSAPVAQAPVWKAAHTTPKGRTNVRAGPTLDSPVVLELAPGTRVLVQSSPTEWWKAKPLAGNAFSGYIRQDRLVFQ